jgi:hypothetical protein
MQEYNRFERKWADLADQLNNLPGPNKTVKEWKEVSIKLMQLLTLLIYRASMI